MNNVELKNNEVNFVISKEKYVNAIKDFKDFIKNKDNYSYPHEIYGHKVEGIIGLKHFMFYAMLRNKDIEKTTHNVESEKYQYALRMFRGLYNVDSIKQAFPSLKKEEIEEIIKNYL